MSALPGDAEALPLVFLPGIDGTRGPRLAFVAEMALKRPVHLIDYDLSAPAEYAALADAVEPRLPDGRFVLMGESYSGPEATLIAARLGERVAGLVLAVTFVVPPLPTPFRALTRWFGTGLVPLAVVERLLLNSERGAVREQLHQAIAAVPDAVMTARAMAALSCDMRAALAAVRCPVLSLEAKRDRLILGHCGREIARVKPERRRVVVDGPHMILETHVQECVRAIDVFCREVEGGLRTGVREL